MTISTKRHLARQMTLNYEQYLNMKTFVVIKYERHPSTKHNQLKDMINYET